MRLQSYWIAADSRCRSECEILQIELHYGLYLIPTVFAGKGENTIGTADTIPLPS